MDLLGICKPLVKVCYEMQILSPTEIQRKTIPQIIEGKNIMGISKTGSGKTACYAIPSLQACSKDPYGVFALVLVPTKELAIQVHQQFLLFASCLQFTDQTALIVGGDSWLNQTRILTNRPYCVIATPGRFISLIVSADLSRCLARLSFLILDEADRLLDGNIIDDVERIFEILPKKRVQTLLFTATRTSQLNNFCCKLPEWAKNENLDIIDLNDEKGAPEQLEHFYRFIPARVKTAYLFEILSQFETAKIIIFTKTCRTCQTLTTTLEYLKLSVTTLHSLLEHQKRVAHLGKFRSGQSRILVATDVGSRGLDIPFVELVINFDFPTTYDDYIHRVGRTARRGMNGMAISLICDKDNTELVKTVETGLHKELKIFEMDEKAVLRSLGKISKAEQEAAQILFEAGFLDRCVAKKVKVMAQRQLKGL